MSDEEVLSIYMIIMGKAWLDIFFWIQASMRPTSANASFLEAGLFPSLLIDFRYHCVLCHEHVADAKVNLQTQRANT